METQPRIDIIKQSNSTIKRDPKAHIKEQVPNLTTIQPHGYLLILSKDFKILKISDNCDALFKTQTKNIIDKPLSKFIDKTNIQNLKTLAKSQPYTPINYIALSVGTDEPCQYHACLHHTNDHLVLELEPAPSTPVSSKNVNSDNHIIEFAIELQKAKDLQSLYQYLTRKINDLTGFDSVKLYQFDRNWNCKVIAESKTSDMPSYLGLQFPSSEIPEQKRALLKKNYQHIVPNIDGKPSKILPDTLNDTETPIDLSFSSLRCAHPMHLEYLKNMGIKASMSISILKNGQLWGLIACHHKQPHHVDYRTRMSAELMAHTFSAYLSNFSHIETKTNREKKQAHLQNLKTAAKKIENLTKLLNDKHDLILKAVNADGVAINIGDKHFTFGLTPTPSFEKNLLKWIESNHSGDVFTSNCIDFDTDLKLQKNSSICGVIVTPTSAAINDYIIWFRKEHSEEIHWAKQAEKEDSINQTNISKSASAPFKTWKEHLRGFTEPWDTEDPATANQILKILTNKHYEDSIKQADYNLQYIFENSLNEIFIFDAQTLNFVQVNRGARKNMGYSMSELSQMTPIDIKPDITREKFDAIVTPLKNKTKEKIIFETRHQRKDGSTYNAEIHLQLEMYKGREAFVAIIIDITDRIRTENEIRRSNKELERVAFIASHDLQEPIRMIYSFTQLLNDAYKDKTHDETAQEYINFTLHAAERMRIMIQDLLQYSRFGHEELQPEIINTKEELQSTLKQFTLCDDHKNAEIVSQDNIPDIAMKPEHFSCIIQNLVGNALKYHAKDRNPVIKITHEDHGDEWCFCVSDNGIGIKNEYLEKVFDIFQRLHQKSEYAGTGIGLSLCARIIERYDGKIWAESELGKGSHFFFTLPKNAKIKK